MRIAVVAETFLPKIDGIVNTLCHLLEHLSRRGHQALVLAPSGAPDRHADMPVVGFPAVRVPFYPELRLALPNGRLSACLDEFRPDLVHVANPLLLGSAAMRLARRRGIPVVGAYHTDMAGFADGWGLGVLRPLIWAMVRAAHGRADLNLCPSQVTLAQLREQGIPRLSVWSRGVDAELFRPSRRDIGWRHRLTDGQVDRPLLLYVGRLSPEKRVDWLADVLDLMPFARLAVVGDGPARPSLEMRLAGRGAVFTGYLSGYALAAAYASADVFVFPGAHETFGNVVLEAMASGLPVVAPAAGAVTELLRHEQNGLLFDPGSRAAMAEAVLRLAQQPLLARRLGRQARLDAEERGWPLVLDGLLDRYQELLLPSAGAESQIATTMTASASGALLAKPLATRPPGAHAA
jgi:glycosyltransferase involved in cell wall biosynthesis